MRPRFSSDQRRLQLIRAALQLLEEVPVEQLTTRRLAEVVGLTQPALFRHFASKQALLEAVVEYLRTSLEELATERIRPASPCGTPREGRRILGDLVAALFAFAERHPGAPRLLFHDAASGSGGGDLGAPLRRLIATQTVFVGELLAGSVERGELPEGLDVERAAELFVALFQGELMRWRLEGGADRPLAERVPGLVELFWSGVTDGSPARGGETEATPERASELLLLLDTRPILAAERDPFDEIHDALARIAPRGALALLVPFRPLPLIGLLEARGLLVTVELLDLPGPELFLVLIHRGAAFLDLSDLPAPEPLESLLAATVKLEPGGQFLARLPRFPRLLLPRLEERGLTWHAAELPPDCGGGALLRIERPDPEHP